MKKLFSYLLISSMVVLSSCTNYDDQFDDLNTQINALKTQIAGFSSLSTGLTSLQGTVASLQSAVANIPATDLSGLESDLTDLSALVKALQAQVAATATALEAGTVSDAAIAAAIKVVQDNQAALDTAVAAVTAAQATLATAADVAAVTAAQTAADAAAVKLAAAVAGLATELTALGTTNAELKTVTDLIQASVALLSSGQAANTTSIATLVDAVAALDTASLSTLINTLSASVTSSTADILAAILAGNNVYTSGVGASALQINSAASLAVAESLGTKLGIINGGITITHTKATAMDAAKLQAVLDNITTVTGVVSYTADENVTAVNFSKLSSAGTLEINAKHAISLAELTTVTNDLQAFDHNEVISFSAPKLTSVKNFNDGATDNKLKFARATSIDLSALSYYDDNGNALTIHGNDLSAGWDLTMPLFQTKTSAGITRATFTLTIGGYANLIELDAMVNENATIAAANAKKIVLDNFLGSITGNHVDVTLGAAKKNYTGGNRLEKVNITGVLTGASIATDKAEGPTFNFDSSTKLVSAIIAGEANDVSFDTNANVETVTISANAVQVGLTTATSLTSATISGNVRGNVNFTGSTSLVDATLSGAVNGTVTFNNNPSLNSVTMTGSANAVVVTGASVLTSLDLGHTTAASVADATKGIANAAKDQAGSLHVYSNPELTSLKADKVATIGSLKVYGNANLASVSFNAISAPAAAFTGTTEAFIGATASGKTIVRSANKLFAQSIVEQPSTTTSLGVVKTQASITTDSGLADLAGFFAAAALDSKKNVIALFDGIDAYTKLDGTVLSDRTYVNDPVKVTIADFSHSTSLPTGKRIANSIAKSMTGLSDTDSGATTAVTLSGNGASITLTKTADETRAAFYSRIEGASLANVTIDTGSIDAAGRVEVVAVDATTATYTLLMGATGMTSGTSTSTSVDYQVIVSATGSNTVTGVASSVAAALNASSVVMNEVHTTGVYTPTTKKFSDLYTASNDGAYIVIKQNTGVWLDQTKTIATATTSGTVVDRMAAAAKFSAFSTTAAKVGTIWSSVNDYYIHLSDDLYGAATTANLTIDVAALNPAITASPIGTLYSAAVNATTGAFTTRSNVTTANHTLDIRATEFDTYVGATSNARTASTNPIFNTTYYTWN